MKKIFVLCCMLAAMLGLMNLSMSSAEAASNSFKSFQQEKYVDETGKDWVRLTFEFEKDTIDYTVSENPERTRQMIIRLKDVNQGKIKSDYTLDGALTRYMTVRKGESKEDKKNLYLTVVVAKSLAEQEYHVYTIPRDKQLKKPLRLVVEVAAEPASDKDVDIDIKDSTSTVKGVAGRTIVVDPGHGGSDSGAVGYVMEKNVTFAVSTKMQKILEASGAKVIMTRTADVDVYGPNASASQELQARCNYCTPQTDLFVCIHANANDNESAHGTETYYCAGSWLGELLATNIQVELIKASGFRDRGIKTANFYVLKHTPVPANLVELGFVTNPGDGEKLGDDEFQNNLAMAVCRGIGNYFATLRENSGMY